MNGIAVSVMLAQATAPDPRAQTLQLVGMLAIMGFMFYFAIFRPQQKKQKEHEKLMKSLKAGDKVIASGGLVGVIVSVKEKTVTLRSADAKLELLKSAVTDITERTDSQPSA
jgi:preprotein translocase subunit YajC